MNRMPDPTEKHELRTAAIATLRAWGVTTPEDAARLLQSWARRGEMTDQDVAAVLEELFPDEPPSETWSTDFRSGYAEGFLDCAQVAAELSDRNLELVLQSWGADR